MYMQGMGRSRGLRRYSTSGLGDFVCPDFPDLSTCYDSAAAQAPAAYVAGAGPLAPGQTRVTPIVISAAPASAQNFTQWVNQNSTTVLIGAGALLLVVALK